MNILPVLINFNDLIQEDEEELKRLEEEEKQRQQQQEGGGGLGWGVVYSVTI